jgi:hypothetical protein
MALFGAQANPKRSGPWFPAANSRIAYVCDETKARIWSPETIVQPSPAGHCQPAFAIGVWDRARKVLATP